MRGFPCARGAANSGWARRIGKHRPDAGIRAGDRAVDALMGEQQRALHAIFFAKRLQRLAQAFEARHGNEMVERRNEEGARRRRRLCETCLSCGCKYSFRAFCAIGAFQLTCARHSNSIRSASSCGSSAKTSSARSNAACRSSCWRKMIASRRCARSSAFGKCCG